MSLALDHVFVCCAEGAPEAAALTAVGVREGSRNTHLGQGTACRRFFFSNAYLELLWVSDAAEAQGETARPTRLWERWSNRGRAASPFGIVLRPADDVTSPEPPFPTWSYRPAYLPPPLAIAVGHGTPMGEPGFFYLGFLRGHTRGVPQPTMHAIPATVVTSVRVWTPAQPPGSLAARAVEAAGLVAFHRSNEHLMELTFDLGDRGATADLRPDLPLVLRW